MLQYRLQPVGNFRCDYATGADFCDAFVTRTDSSYLLAFLLTANHEAAERCFVAALDQAFKANTVFKEWAMLTHTMRSAMTKLLVAAIVFFLFATGHAAAEPQLNLVIAVDLTQSVAVHAPGQPSEFQKNIDGVTKLLAQVPSSSRVTVIGITDQSFTRPDILLSATVPDNPGYFGERLTAARTELVRAWQSRSRRVQPNSPRTDIIGALTLASQLFAEQVAARHRVLVIFSDMQNSTPELNLGTSSGVDHFSKALRQSRVPTADLRSVDVYALGVDADRMSISYWQASRDSWTVYFAKACAVLRRYSTLRDSSQLRLQP
jgi:hypothetical protein